MSRGGTGKHIDRASHLALVTAILCSSSAALAIVQPARAADDQAIQPSARSITMSVPLVWNGQVLGDVIVQAEADGSAVIESQSLRREMIRLLTEAGIERLGEAIGSDPFVSPSQLQAFGFELAFDMARLELQLVGVDPALRPVQPLRGLNDRGESALPTIEPAEFSAYLNNSVSFVYQDGTGIQLPDVLLFGAARYRDVVIEFDGGFTEALNNDYNFYRRGVRAVYDEPDSYRRWSAGDLRLENTGFVRTPFVGGIALEKTRRIFDPYTPAVSLGGREILLTAPSTVEVIVNGAPYQTLDLQPGTYSLDDLPIQLGSNDVQLVVRDASGREQVTRFDYFFDPIELEAGEDEYTLAIGLIADELGLEPTYSSDPAFVGSYRKALSETLIVGGGLQIAEDIQLVSAETRFVPQAIPGSFRLEGAVSTGNGTGFALRGGYRVTFGNAGSSSQITASFDYESDNFRTVGDLSQFRLETLSLTGTFSHAFSARTSVVAGANYFSAGDITDQSSIFFDVSHRLRDNIRANLGVEYGTGSAFGDNFGIRAGISVLLGNRHRADATYQSRRGLGRASLSRGAGNEVGSLGYSLSLQDSQGNTSVDGLADYIGNRFEARASLATVGNSFGGIGDDQTARLQIGSSIAFADGAFGIGRPIQDAFMLARPHETLDGTDVVIGRSLRSDEYEAASGPLGAAVVNRLSSYSVQNVQYDIDTLEAGYDIGAGVVRAKPGYRSGYDLVVGTERFVSAVGFLMMDGAPASLVAGLISSEDDEGFEPQPFFTNSAGRFGIIGLAPGRTYFVRLNDTGRTFVIVVPEDNTGLYRMETIDLRDGAE